MSRGALLVGFALLAVGLILLLAGLSMYGLSSEEFVAWKKSDDRKEGDEVNVHGKISEENQIMGIYHYKLDNNDEASFISDVDIGDVGDDVVVKVRMENALSGLPGNPSMLVPVVQEKLNPGIPVMLGILLLLVGTASIIRMKRR